MVQACEAPTATDTGGASYVDNSGDCDDESDTVNPGVAEACDGIDNNCDGEVDEATEDNAPTWWLDSDGDGVPQNSTRTSCEFEGVGYEFVDGRVVFDDSSDYSGVWIPEADDADEGWTPAADVDCNDNDSDIWPGNVEVCDGKDNDCDGDEDNLSADATVEEAEGLNGEVWYLDGDGDGFGDSDSAVVSCRQPEVDTGDAVETGAVYVTLAGDCDDELDHVNPAAPEVCDWVRDGAFDVDGDGAGIDEDCDGIAEDEGAIGAMEWLVDADGDLAVVDPDETPAVMGCAALPAGSSSLQLVEAHAPPAQATFDATVALYDPTHGFDCDDGNAAINPSATEVCDPDDVDENCSLGGDESTAADALTWYEDGDGDGHGAGLASLACPDNGTEDSTTPERTDSSDPDKTYSLTNDDCDDANSTIHPGGTEVCDADDVDENCDGDADESTADDALTWYADGDEDGFGAGVGALACPDNGTESDPSLSGFSLNDQDCDDTSAAVHPDATEVCDDADVDEDCDGLVDDADVVDASSQRSFYPDGDGDGFGDTLGTSVAQCDPPSGYADNADDCDDGDGAVNPDAEEVCDDARVDEDCDGQANDGSALGATAWYVDIDGDDHGTGELVLGCADTTSEPSVRTGYALTNGDCDDGNGAVNPGALEVCDAEDVDEDCNGLVDDDDPNVDKSGSIEGSEPGVTAYVDDDGDGVGRESSSSVVFCDLPTGYTTGEATDCDDSDASVSPNADEICDDAAVDEDCDGLANESNATDLLDRAPLGGSSYFIDVDGDGYGTDASVVVACSSVTITDSEDTETVYVVDGGDCDDVVDSGEDIHPGMVDVCNGVDDDCSGAIDDLGGVSLQKGVGELATDVSHCFSSYTAYTDSTATLRAVTVTGDGAKGAVVGDTLVCTASYVASDTATVRFVWSSDADNAIDGVLNGAADTDGVAVVTSEYVVTSDDLGSQIDCAVTLETTTSSSVPGAASIYVSDSDELSCDDVLKPATGSDTWTYAFCPTFDSGSEVTDASDESAAAGYLDRSWSGNIAVQSGTVTLLKPLIAADVVTDTVTSWEDAVVTLNGEGESPTVSVASGSDSSTLAIEDLSLFGAVGDNNGGGLYCSGTHTVTLTDTIFDQCIATNGGALYVSGCALTIAGDSLISDSEAYDSGGGVYVTGGGSVTLAAGSIEDNDATQQGGGVYVLEATMTVSGGNISANTADYGAGVYVSGTGSSLDMSGGTIGGAALGNTAIEQGGGVYLGESAAIYLSGGEITHNSAQNVSIAADVGGGIHVDSTASSFPGSWTTVVESNTLLRSVTTNSCDQIFDGTSTIPGCLE